MGSATTKMKGPDMPYQWRNDAPEHTQILQLWPHQSLPRRGMAGFILVTFGFLLIPALAFLGSVILWALLPFLMLALWGMYRAINANYRARMIQEVLTVGGDRVHLIRRAPGQPDAEWDCNSYWAQVLKYDQGGPVPFYITLKGNGREVEIGAFLSEDERVALYEELRQALARA